MKRPAQAVWRLEKMCCEAKLSGSLDVFRPVVGEKSFVRIDPRDFKRPQIYLWLRLDRSDFRGVDHVVEQVVDAEAFQVGIQLGCGVAQ